MTFTYVRRAFLAAVGAVALASPVIAQDRSSRILNSLEVGQLVARAEPADHARLSAHFGALGTRYAAEATRHRAMAQSFVGNPSRTLGTGMSAHCQRLSDLSAQSATTVRELAAYHDKQAAGVAATPPRNSARFHGGAGAPEPTKRELNLLAAKARTPAEHGALQEYFQTLVKRYTTDAEEHIALAQIYRGTRIAHAAVHQDRLAELARAAVKEAEEAAQMHRGVATIAR
jgi:hypothetical protein